MDILSIFYDGWAGVARIAIIAAFAYAGLIMVLRLSGKRALSKLNAFDFVVTVALGSTLAAILLNKDVDLAEGMAAFALLIGLQWIVAYLSVHWRFLRRIVRSEPKVLVRQGELLSEAMRNERITRSEIDAIIRRQGLGSVSDVAWLVLETDGSFSVISKESAGDGSAMESVPGGKE
ncbi:MAG: DUF421 domain-containing protein [Sphingomonadaceae bacterium]|jgi:uncharacterized membrane protein YcaP (DUF421 family)|nr:MAG: DUF421 domain-containing protein [Sphingomonadaceae bacterium]